MRMAPWPVYRAMVLATLALACSDQQTLAPQDSDGGMSAHGPGYRFSGPDAPQRAAIDVLLYTYRDTKRDGIERGGMICRDPDGAAFATEPIVGADDRVLPARASCPRGTKTHGDYHTHPIGPLKNLYAPFSLADTKNCREYEACWVAQMLAPGQQVNVWVWLPGLNAQFHVYP